MKKAPLVLALILAAGCGDDEVTTDKCTGDGTICNVLGVPEFAGFNGDDLPPDETELYWPQDMTLSPSGALIVLDWNNHRVRSLNEATGDVATHVGSGLIGDSEGPALEANLNHPTHIAFDSQGRLILSDFHNWKIKRLSLNGTLETIAGTTKGFSGDSGTALECQFDLPSSTRFDADGNLYVSDQGNGRIRKIDPSGKITTYAGIGGQGFGGDEGPATLAQFNFPTSTDRFAVPAGKIDIGPDMDEILVADTGNHRVREISLATGEIETVAGGDTPGYSGDGGPAEHALLNYPTDVAFGPDHSIYIADSRNHVIRRVDPLGTITTVAGNNTKGRGYSGDGGPATEAQLDFPAGVFVSPDNVLYIADTQNHLIRKVQLP